MNAELREGERIVDLQAGGLCLIQGAQGFRFGTDSVLLADFAVPRRHERIADLGAGDGAVAFLLMAHEPSCTVDMVELDEAAADRARRSIALNALEGRATVMNGDMRTAWQTLGREGHSLVVCNPPYGEIGRTIPNPDAEQRMARHMDDLTCDDVAASAARLLKYGGRFATVFPSARALEMADALRRSGLEPKRLRTVQSTPERAPKLLLMEAVKGAHPGLKWLPALTLYDEDGGFSKEYRRIYGIQP